MGSVTVREEEWGQLRRRSGNTEEEGVGSGREEEWR